LPNALETLAGGEEVKEQKEDEETMEEESKGR
jgi:hypothetical protein